MATGVVAVAEDVAAAASSFAWWQTRGSFGSLGAWQHEKTEARQYK